MKVKYRRDKDRYSITGLTESEMEWLRDLTGSFADNPGDGGIKRHFHTHLFVALFKAVGDGPKRWRFYGHSGECGDVLHCRRWEDTE